MLLLCVRMLPFRLTINMLLSRCMLLRYVRFVTHLLSHLPRLRMRCWLRSRLRDVARFDDKLTCVLTARFETLCHCLPKRSHVGRTVEIKSSERCLTCAFLIVDKNFLLLQSSTNYGQHSRTYNENSSRRLSYQPVEPCQGDNQSARPSTT